MAAAWAPRYATSTTMAQNLGRSVWLRLSLGSWSPDVTPTTRAGVSFARWSSTQRRTRRGRSARAAPCLWSLVIC